MLSSALRTTRKDPGSPWTFCYEILPDVSRTFALTIPVLDDTLADSVCVAYLLCRIADTIEDRNDLELAHRRQLYGAFAALVEDPEGIGRGEVEVFLGGWPRDATPAYQRLMEGMRDVIAAYATLGEDHRRAINACVQEMIGGMSEMTHPEPEDGIVWVCDDLDQLERYCHYVAGTVGLMLTRLFDARIGGGFASVDRLEEGRRFGLGLQLTNILKDHASDAERGTSFMPRRWIQPSGGVRPADLAALLRRTLGHLEVAQDYTLALPPKRSDIRLFCLWALWMAVGTLREVARRRSPKPKITRIEVTEIIAFTRANVEDDGALRQRFETMRSQVHDALETLAGGNR